MNNPRPFHRRIAIVLLAIFLPSLLPVNLLYASNNGPNAFEAATFEPVDAVDMVNLATGDMSYTMPLLNIPSPEGGYPLTLSYKAGVAMDQEASWVGLGWSLNPGAINRSVNGFADDISDGSNETFIYDEGSQSNYYNVGIGGNFNGITVGVGAYWGSNKTFGGSITFGVGPTVGSVATGTSGTNVGFGYSDTAENLSSNISNGVSFRTFKRQGSGFSSNGTGISTSASNISSGDYDISVSSKGFNAFFFYYGHTQIKYSLYKESFDIYSGILYPYSLFGTNNVNYYLKKNSDTKRLIMYDGNIDNIISINDVSKLADYKRTLLPNYDSYSVSSQGISGYFSPSFNSEVELYSRNNHDLLSPQSSKVVKYYFFKNNENLLDYNLKLNSKLFFEFNNTNASFLRINRANIIRNTAAEADLSGSNNSIDYKQFICANTTNSFLYNETITAEGIAIKTGDRKRTGKYIESFTNSQISAGNINFVEAKNLNRTDVNTYNPESIGAFRITDNDGKTYHYSLPVINFQTWYKNFGISNNENSEFYLSESNNPYATDWLLTAVTGPDYVDSNNNNILDNEDYGYWIEFDYGKWTDGYIWQSSSGESDLVQGDFRDNNRYEFYRGRKQVYYLDAVRTRTHTAYFIKSLRKDAQGKKVIQYTSRANNPSLFNLFSNSSSYSSVHYDEWSYITGKSPRIPVPLSLYNIPTHYQGHLIDKIYGYKKNYVYADFPSHYSLKLDKIVLLKNTSNVLINKASGSNLLPSTQAYYSKNRAFEITGIVRENGANLTNDSGMNGTYTQNINPLKVIDIHTSSNIIDQGDLNGIDINEKALKVIDFEYDINYPLMPNSPSSSASNKGKLTLCSIDFKGKKGVSFMPKYKFSYNLPSIAFDVNEEDAWGYHKSNPTAWSLNEITTPTGGQLRVFYETDDYNSVASLSSRIFSKGLSFFITKNYSTDELYFKVTRNPGEANSTLTNFTTFLDYFKINEKISLDLFICRRSKYGGHFREAKLNVDGVKGQITNVDQNSVIFKIPNNSVDWHFDDQSEGWIVNRDFSLTSVRHSDGSHDSYIMRDAGYQNCPEWRSSYSRDDINVHYKLASSSTPIKGKGGGVRVKTISMHQDGKMNSLQKYFYNNPNYSKEPNGIGYKSSGSTSFVPYKEPVVLPYASELPPPVVLYKNVSVEIYGQNSSNMLSKTDYTFETLNNFSQDPNFLYSLGDKLSVKETQNEVINPQLNFSKFEIKNKFNDLGRLNSIKYFNEKGQLLSSQILSYKADLDNHGETGVKQEAFISRSGFHGGKLNVSSISKTFYPSKLESLEFNSNGFNNKISYDKYDFFTGEPLETKTTSSDGKTYKTKIVPAYTKYASMGSKVDNINNRNMLLQTAASYSYIQDNGVWKETGVGITTWNNEWVYQDLNANTTSPTNPKEKIWRKHKSYIWNGVTDTNGIFENYDATNNTDDGFIWTVGVGTVQPSQWKQTSEVTLYDHYSKPLEVKDINGNKAATKMDIFNEKVQATGNAGYNEMYYSGAEESIHDFYVGQEVRLTNANTSITSNYAHTGKNSVAATDATQFGVFMYAGHRRGKYKISVWAHKNNYQKARLRWFNNDVGNTFEFNGEKYFAGDWVLLNHYVDANYMDLNNTAAYWYVNSIDSTTVYFDDLMIRPIASAITGYVYNEYDELTHIINNNGLATRFEYDAAGRLIKTYTEILDDPANGVTGGFKLSTKSKINYRHMN